MCYSPPHKQFSSSQTGVCLMRAWLYDDLAPGHSSLIGACQRSSKILMISVFFAFYSKRPTCTNGSKLSYPYFKHCNPPFVSIFPFLLAPNEVLDNHLKILAVRLALHLLTCFMKRCLDRFVSEEFSFFRSDKPCIFVFSRLNWN